MGKHRYAIVAAATTLVVIVLVAWLGTRDAPTDADSNATVAAERRTFSATVVAVGAVNPRIGAEVRVGSRISGRVRRLRANVGDRVASGQVIAELETEDLDALVAQRRAEVRLAEAELAAVDVLSPEEVGRATSDVTRFEASAKLASAESERQQKLKNERVITSAEAEAAEERRAVAQAQLESARRELTLARARSAELRKQKQADVERARAELTGALVQRSFAVIRAPISGIVSSVSTQEGETVAAGLSAPTFLTIVDLERLQVMAFVDEVDIGKVRIAQEVQFTVDAFPARDFAGRVAAIYPSATIQDNVVKYIVAVDIAGNYAGQLRPEMTTSVRIKLEARNVVAVPARSIRRVNGRSEVYVVVARRIEPRAIRVGWRDGPWAEVVEGLAAGERIRLNPPATEQDRNR